MYTLYTIICKVFVLNRLQHYNVVLQEIVLVFTQFPHNVFVDLNNESSRVRNCSSDINCMDTYNDLVSIISTDFVHKRITVPTDVITHVYSAGNSITWWGIKLLPETQRLLIASYYVIRA